ncbi:hypothetical protein Bhyg_07685 [Pseudolycoriella hygida]|uniref:PHD-type domain-containing protein n=1 Tax=Pseudolycoriella hygida TaxID=35572 RepID=A0A9Q0N445_9DIPT|nr:hypothetical protein Bhyg_07685 [Pseudolycoriella hygida]
MTTQCKICSKRQSRANPLASCTACKATYHRACGQITDPIFNAILNDAIEWKCLQCRRTSSRVSGTFLPSTSQRKLSSNPTNETSTPTPDVSNIAKLEQTINSLANELQTIKSQQSVINTSIDKFSNGLKDLQLITKTLGEHDRRLETAFQVGLFTNKQCTI